MSNVEVIRVAADTNCQNLGGSIAKAVAKGNHCEITAIGAGAINQAVKGLAISRRMVATTGYDLVFRVGFLTVDLSQEGGKDEITAIKFVVSVQ